MQRLSCLGMALVGSLVGIPPALACPLCDTGTGQQVRSGILGADFAGNLLGVLAPFALLLLIVAALHFGLPGRRPMSQPMSQMEGRS